MRVASVKVHWGEVSTPDRAMHDCVAAARAVLSAGDAALDYSRSKLAFDQLVNPAHAVVDTMGELGRLVDGARRLAGRSALADAQLAALRQLLYVAGSWNEHRPFAYGDE